MSSFVIRASLARTVFATQCLPPGAIRLINALHPLVFQISNTDRATADWRDGWNAVITEQLIKRSLNKTKREAAGVSWTDAFIERDVRRQPTRVERHSRRKHDPSNNGVTSGAVPRLLFRSEAEEETKQKNLVRVTGILAWEPSGGVFLRQFSSGTCVHMYIVCREVYVSRCPVCCAF